MIERETPQPLPIVGTWFLSQRWRCSQKTVRLVCKMHGLRAIRLTDGIEGVTPLGPILYRWKDIQALERKLSLI